MILAQQFASAIRDEQSPVGKWLDELAETATELDAEAAERGTVAPLIIEAIVEELLQWALAPITAGASVAIGKAIQLMGTLIKQFGKRVLDRQSLATSAFPSGNLGTRGAPRAT